MKNQIKVHLTKGQIVEKKTKTKDESLDALLYGHYELRISFKIEQSKSSMLDMQPKEEFAKHFNNAVGQAFAETLRKYRNYFNTTVNRRLSYNLKDNNIEIDLAEILEYYEKKK